MRLRSQTSLLPLLLLAWACGDAPAPDRSDVAAFVAQDDDLAALLRREGELWVTPPIAIPDGADRVGLRFDAPSDVVPQVRRPGGAWLPAVVTYRSGPAGNAHRDLLAGAAVVEIGFPVVPTFLAVEVFRFDPDPRGDEPFRALAQGLAADGVAVPRSQWGARATSCSGNHTPNRMTVHHTVTPNNDSMTMPERARQIQAYHIDSRGWCDVGYHFLVGQDGQVYQGRLETLIGAHAGGANTDNAGVSFIGTFTDVAPSEPQMDAGRRIVAALSSTYGIPLDRQHVFGHREVGTTATACPGDQLFARLTDLFTVAGPPALAAEFVGQGSDAPGDPDGVAYYRVCAGQPVQMSFELRNTGAASWVDWPGDQNGQSVRLGVPGDGADPIAGRGRVSLNESSNVDVHPDGPDCNDQLYCRRTVFRIGGTAPAPGVVRSTWRLVDEGRAWFGPEMWLSFNVVDCTPAYRGELVAQGFDPVTELAPGEERAGFFELRNTGTAAWRTGTTMLATSAPRGRDSAFAHGSWPAPSRPATVDRDVPPGETGRFAFTLRAPDAPGEHDERFTLVEELVAWFADQGGPPDDLLGLRVIVGAPPEDPAEPPVEPEEPPEDPAEPPVEEPATPPADPPLLCASQCGGGAPTQVRLAEADGCSHAGGAPALGGFVALLLLALRPRRPRRIAATPSAADAG